MISIVTHGRNDDWQGVDWNGKTYLDSFYESLTKNIDAIEKLDVPYEYLIVEWCPINEYLMNIPRFKELFETNKNLKTIVVDKSVAVADGLSPTQYFEYFAKNVGIRYAKYENIILTNTDIIIYPKSMRIMIDLVKAGLDDKTLYRLIWRFHGAGPHPQEQTGVIENNNPKHGLLCGAFPGDIHLATRKCHEFANGYDESNSTHRTISQVGMDGEFINNIIEKGGKQEWLPISYWHINHNHPHKYDDGYTSKMYENKSNWGFIKYPINAVTQQFSIITL